LEMDIVRCVRTFLARTGPLHRLVVHSLIPSCRREHLPRSREMNLFVRQQGHTHATNEHHSNTSLFPLSHHLHHLPLTGVVWRKRIRSCRRKHTLYGSGFLLNRMSRCMRNTCTELINDMRTGRIFFIY
jgi:hypothetical protein